MEMASQMSTIKDSIRHMHKVSLAGGNGSGNGNVINLSFQDTETDTNTNTGHHTNTTNNSHHHSSEVLQLLQSLDSANHTMNQLLETHLQAPQRVLNHSPPPPPVYPYTHSNHNGSNNTNLNSENMNPNSNNTNSSSDSLNLSLSSSLSLVPYDLPSECSNINKKLVELNQKHALQLIPSTTTMTATRTATSGGFTGGIGNSICTGSNTATAGKVHHTPELKPNRSGATLHTQYQHNNTNTSANTSASTGSVVDNGLCIGSVLDDVSSSHNMLYSIASKYN